MWSRIRRSSSLLTLQLRRAFSYPVVDQFKIDSCQELMNKMHSRLVSSAQTSGTRYPPPIPNVQFQSGEIRKRGVQIFSAYSDASVLNHHKIQTVRDAAISSLLCEDGIPQAAMIASFRGEVTSTIAESFGIMKSNWLLDLYWKSKADVYTDAQSVSRNLNKVIFNMKKNAAVLVKDEFKIIAARMIISGRDIQWVKRADNVIPHFMAEFAQFKMPRQVITKPKAVISAFDVTEVKVYDFSTLEHDLDF